MKRIYKILYSIATVFIIIISLLLLTFYNPVFQTYITKKISKYYSDKLNSKIEITNVALKFYNSFALKGVFVSDLKNDTVFYSKEIIIKIDSINFGENNIFASEISVSNAVFKYTKDIKNNSNIKFLTTFFSSSDTTNSSDGYKIFSKNLKIENSKIIYRNDLKKNDSDNNSKIDYNFLVLNNINIDVEDIYIRDTISFKITNLCASEKKGFKIKKISALINISGKNIDVNNLILKTKLSEIYSKKIRLDFDTIEEIYEYPYKSNSKIILDSAILSTNEFKYFTEDFPEINTKIKLQGEINTNPDSIFLKKFKALLSKNSSLYSDIVIKNISGDSEIFCDSLLSKISFEDYNNLELNKAFSYKFTLPKNFQSLQQFLFSGKLSFKKNTLSVTGTFFTQIGEFLSEFTMTNYENRDVISAKIKSNKIRTDKISTVSSFKFMKFNFNTTAEINNKGNVKYKAKLYADKLLYNNYLYKKIKINSTGINNIYDLEILTKDENLNSFIKCNFTDAKELSITKLSVNVYYANLLKLNLDTSFRKSEFKGFCTAEIKGNNIDNLNGFLGANDVTYKINNDSIYLSTFILTANKYEKQRIIKAESDYFDIDIRGIYNFNTLKNAGERFISKYIPSYNEKSIISTEEDKNQIINFTADFKNLSKINQYFFPSLNISDSSHIEAFFKTKNSYLDLQIFFPYITLNKNIIKNLKIQCYTDKDNLNLTLNSNFNIDKESDKYNHKLLYIGVLNNDKLNSIISWHNTGKTVYGGDISLITNFDFAENTKVITTIFSPTKIKFADETWDLNGNSAVYKNNKLKLNKIQISDSIKKIILNGYISYDEKDILSAEIYDFNIKNISQTFLPDGFTAEGDFNGNFIVHDILQNPYYEMICRIVNFKINEQDFGDLSLTAEQDILVNSLNISAFAMNGTNRFSIEGSISDLNEINFNTTMNNLDLKIIKPLIPEDFEIKAGTLYGNAQIFGNINDINWTGTLSLKDTHVKYKFLETDFKFSTIIALSKNNLYIPKTEISDVEDNKAFFDLEASHNNFENAKFSINFSTNKFIFLNSQHMNDEGIYGKLYTSGDATIKGTEKEVKIEAALTTLPGSELFVVTTEEEQVENTDYLFFGEKQLLIQKEKENTDFSNIKMDFNLDITPQTNLTIILDQATGDALALNGDGLLNFTVNNSGQTNVSGEYVFNKGKYNFYVENIYGKEFLVEENSKIIWDGSPFDANIDITTVYNINKAEIYDFTLDESQKGEYVPVSCKILLSEKLMKPKIKFAVEILEKENSASSMMKNLPEDEINKQFLSLLVLNSFQPLPGLTKPEISGEEDNINVAEILAGQLGSLVSLLSDDFEVDVKYNQKSTTNNDEIEVDFSTGILDDRITINGNVAKGEYRNTTNNIVGDFEAEIKMNNKGNVKMKVFNKSNRNITVETGPYTQGISLFYKTEFNSLFKRKKKKKNINK